jgi:hypothetical protein
VWDGLRHALHLGDLGEWRDSLVRLEQHCAQPLLRDLRHGRIAKITLDVLLEQGSRLGSQRYTLERGGAWRFWRLPQRMEHYAG